MITNITVVKNKKFFHTRNSVERSNNNVTTSPKLKLLTDKATHLRLEDKPRGGGDTFRDSQKFGQQRNYHQGGQCSRPSNSGASWTRERTPGLLGGSSISSPGWDPRNQGVGLQMDFQLGVGSPIPTLFKSQLQRGRAWLRG